MSAALGNKNVRQLQIGCIKGCLSFNEAQDVSFSDPVASILNCSQFDFLSPASLSFPDCSRSANPHGASICCGRPFTTSAACSVSPPAAWRTELAAGMLKMLLLFFPSRVLFFSFLLMFTKCSYDLKHVIYQPGKKAKSKMLPRIIGLLFILQIYSAFLT